MESELFYGLLDSAGMLALPGWCILAAHAACRSSASRPAAPRRQRTFAGVAVTLGSTGSFGRKSSTPLRLLLCATSSCSSAPTLPSLRSCCHRTSCPHPTWKQCASPAFPLKSLFWASHSVQKVQQCHPGRGLVGPRADRVRGGGGELFAVRAQRRQDVGAVQLGASLSSLSSIAHLQHHPPSSNSARARDARGRYRRPTSPWMTAAII
jgi:hypothetical protein